MRLAKTGGLKAASYVEVPTVNKPPEETREPSSLPNLGTAEDHRLPVIPRRPTMTSTARYSLRLFQKHRDRRQWDLGGSGVATHFAVIER